MRRANFAAFLKRSVWAEEEIPISLSWGAAGAAHGKAPEPVPHPLPLPQQSSNGNYLLVKSGRADPQEERRGTSRCGLGHSVAGFEQPGDVFL